VDLTETPFFLLAGLEADDMPEAATDRWAGEVPDPGTVIDLEVEAPAGPNRRLSLVAFLRDGSTVWTYRYYESIPYLSAGDQSMEAPLELAATWTLEGTLTGLSEIPEAVLVQDILAGVRFPQVPVQPDGTDGSFVIESIPVGRFFYLRLKNPSGELSEPLYFCPLFFGESAFIVRVIDLTDESC
jgi:hypothetical protein